MRRDKPQANHVDALRERVQAQMRGGGKPSTYTPGHRYDLDADKAAELEAELILSGLDRLDASRGTRFMGGGQWQCWTYSRRRCDVVVIAGRIKSAVISINADPDIPPVRR